MSPFAITFGTLRHRYKIQQTEISRRVGCDRGYLSALENDHRPAPSPELLEKLIAAMDLTIQDAAELRAAREKSRREFHLQGNLHPDAYRLCHEIFQRIDRLTPSHITALLAVLKI